MAQRYNIHPDFKKLRYLRMPRNMTLMKISNFFLSVIYRLQSVSRTIKVYHEKVMMRDGKQIRVDHFSAKIHSGVLPCLLYFPGGGFMMRATHIHKKNVAIIAQSLRVKVMLVHYRLAPKYPFPTAFFDVIDVFNHVYTKAEELGIDPQRIGVGGDSAGGNLACSLALFNQDELHRQLRPTMLIYPALDRGKSSHSRKTYSDTPMFHSGIFEVVGRTYYRNGYFGLDRYAFPIEHPDPSRIGPVYVETAEYDPLHDDGILFYEKLKSLGVECELNDTKGTVHGYDLVRKSEILKRSVNRRKEFLEKYL